MAIPITVATNVTVQVGAQGVPGVPGTAAAHASNHEVGGTDVISVEDLAAGGTTGQVPTSNGAGGLTMQTPAGGGNVVSPGSEASGTLAEFTGSNAIGETAITTASVSAHLADTSNPHSVTAAQASAEPAGSIATHAADADAHHDEAHTLASHSDVSTTGAALDAHIADVTGNPHAVTAAQAGAEPAGSVATHAALADAHHDEAHTLASHSDVTTTGAQLDAHLASSSNPHSVTAAQAGADPTGTATAAVSAHDSNATAHSNLPVEALTTAGTSGQTPVSDGAGNLVMTTPASGGNVTSPGGETAGRITKFTGGTAIDETATTETELATAVTHSGIVTGNPHALGATDVGAEASGSIATHAALANAHHDEAHTLASHSDVATTGAQLDAHLASTSNPHSVTAAQAGADATGTAAAAVSAHDSNASAHSNLPVEALATAGASGQVPTSDGAGGLTMETPASGGGNVTSPGGETAGRITKFTGANDIGETATTETELATAVTHSGVVTGNPHVVTAAQVGAEASGSIATHAALANAHHAETHTLASHSDVVTTGAQLDAHLASTSNPHSTGLSNLSSGSLADLNAAVTNATFETAAHYYRPCDLVSTLDADWAVNGNAPLSADTLDPSILVRRSDDTTEEGFGVQLPPIPVGATNMQIALEVRPQSGPAGSVVAKTLFYERDETTAVGSWSSSIALDDISLPVTSVDYINVVTDKTLATWGLVAGNRYRVQITRTATGDTLSGDLVTKGVKVSFT